MGELNLLSVAIGALALLAGLMMLVRAIKGRPGEDPKSAAMLIGGMMAAAFGLAVAGFAIAYATAENPR